MSAQGFNIANRAAQMGRKFYFAEAAGAAGILEALDYYDFFQNCRMPEQTENH